MAEPVVLGIDFGGTKVALAVSDLNGCIVDTHLMLTRPEDGAAAALERGIASGRQLVNRLGRPYGLAGVGVSTIGVPLPSRVDLAPAIPGWEELALQPAMEDAFGVPALVANDVKMAATAEARWGALAGADPAIYLNLGTGLAAAIVAGGHVISGAHGASGEIGYNLTEVSQVGGALGTRPVLEDTVSGMGLAARGSGLLGRPVTAVEMFGTVGDGSPLASLVDEFLAHLSLHLVNLVIAVDPERVAIGGGMTRSWSRLYPPLEQALKAGVPFPPELVRAARPFDAALMGALWLGLRAAGGEPPASFQWLGAHPASVRPGTAIASSTGPQPPAGPDLHNTNNPNP
jgi:glucokinase